MARSHDPQQPDRPDSFAERLKQKYGEGVDPGVSLGEESSESPSGATSELLKRLAEHGVKSPRYKLEGEVARGGMGAILRVWDEDLRRHLAMKVVLGKGDVAGGGGTPQLEAKVLARFLEEAQVTGQLDHPGIVPVHELGLDADGRVYFTMKLVKGRDLKAIFDLVFHEKEGWNETRALGVILKACEAMAYAHKKGVIHRDLKPANIMVGGFGEVFVMDWGLARVIGRKDSHDVRIALDAISSKSVRTERREEREDAPDSPLVTMDGDVVGTPAYMPPEQARGEVERLSARSDVYAVGAMLYHLLTRQMPYVPPGARVTNRTVLLAVVHGPPAPLLTINRKVPLELVAICEKAMAREAADRYSDTLALAGDLRAFLEGRVVAAYESGAIAELRKWIRRNRILATFAGAALVLLIGGLIVAGLMNSLLLASRADLLTTNTQLRETTRRLQDSETNLLTLTKDLEAAQQQLKHRTGLLLEQNAEQDKDLRKSQEDLERTRQEQEELLRQLEQTLGNKDPTTVSARANLGATMFRIGDLNQARYILVEALAQQEATLSADDPNLQRTRTLLGRIRFAFGDLAGARTLFESVLEVSSGVLPEDHPYLQAAREDLATLLSLSGELQPALELQEKIVSNRESTLPNDHPDLQRARLSLAITIFQLGDLPRARALQEKVLEVYLRTVPEDHPDLQEARLSLATTMKALGDLAGARALEQAVLEVRSRTLPDDHLALLEARMSLAATIKAQGDLPGARALEEKILEICERTQLVDHPFLHLARSNLALTMRDTGDLVGARSLQEKVLEANLRMLPEDHPEVLDVRRALVVTLLRLGDRPQAKAIQEEIIETLSRTRAEDDPDLAAARSALGEINEGIHADQTQVRDGVCPVCQGRKSLWDETGRRACSACNGSGTAPIKIK